MTIHELVTTISFSAYPLGHQEWSTFLITVEARSPGLYAVKHHGESYCTKTQSWDYESIPSEREDQWLADHRYSLEEATAIAKAEVPLIRVNGKTADEWETILQKEEPSNFSSWSPESWEL